MRWKIGRNDFGKLVGDQLQIKDDAHINREEIRTRQIMDGMCESVSKDIITLSKNASSIVAKLDEMMVFERKSDKWKFDRRMVRRIKNVVGGVVALGRIAVPIVEQV